MKNFRYLSDKAFTRAINRYCDVYLKKHLEKNPFYIKHYKDQINENVMFVLIEYIKWELKCSYKKNPYKYRSYFRMKINNDYSIYLGYNFLNWNKKMVKNSIDYSFLEFKLFIKHDNHRKKRLSRWSVELDKHLEFHE